MAFAPSNVFALLILTQLFNNSSSSSHYPAGNYMFQVNNRNTRAQCEICCKLTIKTPERCHNFEQDIALWVTNFLNLCLPINIPLSVVLDKDISKSNANLFSYWKSKVGEIQWFILYFELDTQSTILNPAVDYMFKVTNRSTGTRCEIYAQS